MIKKRPFHHALKVREDVCRGCTRCMKNCPTEAIRIIRGKAQVNPELCIDCGQCLNACPYHAIVIEQDDFTSIFNYTRRVAILPSVFIGQFPDDIEEDTIYQSLLDIGFTDFYEAEFGVDILQSIAQRFSTYASYKPVISSYCPAIVRLIQIRYPSLVDHVNLLRPPVEITALYVRRKLSEQGIKPEDIGVFYVTPCAAKIADIKTPGNTLRGSELGQNDADSPLFDGVINLDFLYNLVRSNIVKNKNKFKNSCAIIPPLTKQACLWSLTQGESRTVPGRSLAIDEIHNVIEFLERLENDEIDNLDFLELRACAQGCAGGILNPSNRFLTTERLQRRSENLRKITDKQLSEIRKRSSYLEKHIKLESIEAKSSLQLDDDIAVAIKKMEEVKKILKSLPNIDCGLCGAPTCEALAKDIVAGKAHMSDCTVLQLRKTAPSIQRIWGDSLKKT